MNRELTAKENKIVNAINSRVKLTPLSDMVEYAIIKDSKRFVVRDPVVYKIDGTDQHLVLGKLELSFDMSKLREILKKQNINPDMLKDLQKEDEKKDNPPKEVLSDDVTVLMEECGLTKEEAEAKLKECGNDVIEAMLKLTKK
ncbi:Nascent polypeptide-associated complex subunit alpha [Astathelohania contejeani]|uniref:Nascent polypeptide-associated complex subunit alpha n=1 Tax=Astathelohania contejeani TaxID=164912 RepID=A0ABQ7I063_9MICR|nr:Nascent polypeptide-associated complex subunit alpha [Thelohania contejeani]